MLMQGLLLVSQVQARILKQLLPLHFQPAVLEGCAQSIDQQAQDQPAQHGHVHRTH